MHTYMYGEMVQAVDAPWSQGPDSAVIDHQHDDPMRPGGHSRRATEVGFFSPSWWRRDSARRLPLR
jgi:hypothetical protein